MSVFGREINQLVQAYLFRGLESRHSSSDFVGQAASGLGGILGVELFCQGIDLVDSFSDTPPLGVLRRAVGLAVYTEAGIILPLDQVIFSLVAIVAPVLDRQRLVDVVFAAIDLVRVFDGL